MSVATTLITLICFCFGQFLHYHIIWAHNTWSIYWSWCVLVCQACITWPWPQCSWSTDVVKTLPHYFCD